MEFRSYTGYLLSFLICVACSGGSSSIPRARETVTRGPNAAPQVERGERVAAPPVTYLTSRSAAKRERFTEKFQRALDHENEQRSGEEQVALPRVLVGTSNTAAPIVESGPKN